MFTEKATKYFSELNYNLELPAGVELLNPYKQHLNITIEFFDKYYNDDNLRKFIFGINPGRYGGGLTGISFTDPVALRKYCGINNNLGDKRELSSEFIYMVIEEMGGVDKFFKQYFFTALFPLALVKDGKNYNFYDDKKTFNTLLPLLKKSVKEQSDFGSYKNVVISLGLKNAGILSIINDELKIFKRIEVLEHPRFIMQYKRKYLKDYIRKYNDVLSGG